MLTGILNRIGAALLCLPFVMFAQDVERAVLQISERIEQKVAQKEDGWQLVLKRNAYGTSRHQWKAKDQDITLTINHYTSIERAEKALIVSRNAVMVGVPEKAGGIGDEAYVWRFNDGRASVRFRNGTDVVSIDASSLETAERFAKHAIDGIAGK